MDLLNLRRIAAQLDQAPTAKKAVLPIFKGQTPEEVRQRYIRALQVNPNRCIIDAGAFLAVLDAEVERYTQSAGFLTLLDRLVEVYGFSSEAVEHPDLKTALTLLNTLAYYAYPCDAFVRFVAAIEKAMGPRFIRHDIVRTDYGFDYTLCFRLTQDDASKPDMHEYLVPIVLLEFVQASMGEV